MSTVEVLVDPPKLNVSLFEIYELLKCFDIGRYRIIEISLWNDWFQGPNCGPLNMSWLTRGSDKCNDFILKKLSTWWRKEP